MKKSQFHILSFLSILLTYISSCCPKQEALNYDLIEVAQSVQLWTGVAVSQEGRIFVNYPRWSPDVPISVAELIGDSTVKAYPDERWNSWNPSTPASENYFICVQSVYMDRQNNLWIVDSGLDFTQGIIVGGPKIIMIDLATNKIVQKINFTPEVAPPGCYLNDMRVDTKRNYAYLTDSGLGALIVVNLTNQQSRRVLAEHASTKSEDITLIIEGEQWLGASGKPPRIHADGLALDANGDYLYYQALTGHSLYRVHTKWLRHESLTEKQLGEKVEFSCKIGASDAIEFGIDGYLYLTSLEYNAIRRCIPGKDAEIVIQDTKLKWPDSFSVTADSAIYVTTSQLHWGSNRTEPYRLFKLQPQ